MPWQALCYVPPAFLFGSVLFSYHIPLWLARVDIVQKSGDHNPGTANAFRYAGVPIGMLCLVLDMLKGALPVWLFIRRFGIMNPVTPLMMLAPIAGHVFTFWYPFRGGKGIATAFGVLIGLFPFSQAAWVLAFWYLFFSLVVVVHPNERRTVYAFLFFVATCAAGALWMHRLVPALGCMLTAMLPVYKNGADIRRAENEMKRMPTQPTDADVNGRERTA